jgi:hypothetical protein
LFAIFAGVAYLGLSAQGYGNATTGQTPLWYEFSNNRVVYAAGVQRGVANDPTSSAGTGGQAGATATGVTSAGGRGDNKSNARESEEDRVSSSSNSSSSGWGASQPGITPEPAVLPLFGLASFGLLARRRRG